MCRPDASEDAMNVAVYTEPSFNDDAKRMLQSVEMTGVANGDLFHLVDEINAAMASSKPRSSAIDHFNIDLDQVGHVLKVLKSIGWERVSSLSPDLRHATLTISDSRRRCHCLQVQFCFDPPLFKCETDLPFCLEFGEEDSLEKIWEAFSNGIDQCQDFWLQMDEIDRKAKILDPLEISRSHRYRRIYLDSCTSMMITVDPMHPRSLPDICIIGSGVSSDQYRNNMNSNVTKWNLDLPLLDNIEALLGVELTQGVVTNEDDLLDQLNCLICLDADKVPCPDQSCKHCSKTFHYECLLKVSGEVYI
ncbi:unnamed protein product [Soboliphyme baturini]|uniref:WD-3 domain-containing protein n=1 Tax=Soboliphyme baturini TaxID=241478 RepID=A0A183IKY7_9BILA|nr:unnamed protein product [Soboliphyme baturini]